MEKVWFVKIGGVDEGPYNIQELKSHQRITPDTLVWKKGFKSWIAIRYVKELKEVFKDEENEQDQSDEEKQKLDKGLFKDEIALSYTEPPPLLFYWIIFTIIVIFYIFHQLYR